MISFHQRIMIKSKTYPYNYLTRDEFIKERLSNRVTVPNGIKALTLPNMSMIK